MSLREAANEISVSQEHMYQVQLRDEDCETAEEAITDSLGRNYSMNSLSGGIDPGGRSFPLDNIQIPIVGYEVMEERARFTVFKLRVENKASGDCWYVFRRYTDFVRLCSRLKGSFPDVAGYLPRKRWFKDNFEPAFLEERVSGLQTLVNAILAVPQLVNSEQIQDFFCLNESPALYSDSNEESRAMFEALEDTIYQLKQQIKAKDNVIDKLEDRLHSQSIENANLRKVVSNSIVDCQKCQKEFENNSKVLTNTTRTNDNGNDTSSPI